MDFSYRNQVETFIAKMKSEGISIRLTSNEAIQFESPVGKMTDQYKEFLRVNKAEIIRLMKSRKSFGICLTCPHASYQDKNGSPFLFCGLEKRNVVDLLVCQKDVWKKDHLNRLI